MEMWLERILAGLLRRRWHTYDDLIVLCAACHQLFHRQFRPASSNRSLRRARVRRSL